jgi:tyrosine phenol-lyase
VIPGNRYFTTTRLHQELAGGRFTDVIIDEAHEPDSLHPFKGNVDLNKLELVLRKNPDRVPYVCVGATVSMAGGQPIALGNLRAVNALCQRYGVKVMRIAENAYCIQEREEEQPGRTIAQIVLDLCRCSDGCTMSAKKDPLANIGGFGR